MREFEEYLPAPQASRQTGRESKQKRLKVFRPKAVRARFKKAWQKRDYATMIAVARKIPEKILQEDPGTTRRSQEWEANNDAYFEFYMYRSFYRLVG